MERFGRHHVTLTLSQFSETPRVLSFTLMSLRLGTFHNLVTVRTDNTLLDVAERFTYSRTNMLPVVGDHNLLVGAVTVFDILHFGRSCGWTGLATTTVAAVCTRAGQRATMTACRLTDTLGTIIVQFAYTHLSHLLCINENRKLIGVVALASVLGFFA